MAAEEFRWPLRLSDGEIELRPIRFRDKPVWGQVRRINRDWLSPWEATLPHLPFGSGDGIGSNQIHSFYSMIRFNNREARALRSLSLGIWIKDGKSSRFIGQITLGGLIFGAYRGGHIGYWIDQRYAGRGLMTRSVRLLTEYAFDVLQLHRVEINMRPENEASQKVAKNAGYSLEGSRKNYLHIDGAWRDHLSFVRENQKI